MKRQEDPLFSCFSVKEMKKIVRTPPPCDMRRRARRNPSPYICATEVTARENDAAQHDAIAGDIHASRAFFGRSRGRLVLWASGSILQWTARSDGWSNRTRAENALRATYWAARRWTRVLGGRLSFRYVERFDDACFSLTPGGNSLHGPGLLATAFSPSDWQSTMCELRLYNSAFSPQNRRFLRSTLLHELGHVVGLRHECAQDGTANRPPEDRRCGPQSVRWGQRNPKSVMAHYRGQRLQQSDIDSVCSAYDRLYDGSIVTAPGRFGAVTKLVCRVHPNN